MKVCDTVFVAIVGLVTFAAPTLGQQVLLELPKGALDPVRNAGDVDLDGVNDVLVGSRVHSGAGGALLLDLSDSLTWGGSVDGVGDFDGDGWPDVALMDGYGYLDVRSGRDGAMLFHQGCPHPPFCFTGYEVRAAGDVDGDGLADLLFSELGFCDGGGVQVVRGPGIGDFLTNAGISGCTNAAYRGVAGPGDLDGDGLDDFVFARLSEGCAGCNDGESETIARSGSGGVL